MIYTDFLNANELKALTSSMNSRAKQAKASGILNSVLLRDRIYESGGKCEWCTISVVGEAFEVDHIIPLYRGGGNIAENIAVACPTCNRSKSDKHPARFAHETYARTGILTILLERVLKHYEAEATTQKSLFDSPDDESPQISPEEDSSDDPPPYTWGKS
jgi:hypothetical protein